MANIRGNPQIGGRPFQQVIQTLTTPTPLAAPGPRTETNNPANIVFGLANRNQITLIRNKQTNLYQPQPIYTPQYQYLNPTTLMKLATLNHQLKNNLYPPTKWIIR
jgi:hypothetical protein